MLKWLRVIGDDGMSIGVWNKLRVASTKEETLADLVREAYAPIFKSTDLSAASRDDIEGAFLQAYSIGVATRHIGCFLTLCRHAGIEVAAATQRRESSERKPRAPKPDATKPRPERQPASKRAAPAGRTAPTRDRAAGAATATVALNVEIPADWDEAKVRERLAVVAQALRDNGLA